MCETTDFMKTGAGHTIAYIAATTDRINVAKMLGEIKYLAIFILTAHLTDLNLSVYHR